MPTADESGLQNVKLSDPTGTNHLKNDVRLTVAKGSLLYNLFEDVAHANGSDNDSALLPHRPVAAVLGRAVAFGGDGGKLVGTHVVKGATLGKIVLALKNQGMCVDKPAGGVPELMTRVQSFLKCTGHELYVLEDDDFITVHSPPVLRSEDSTPPTPEPVFMKLPINRLVGPDGSLTPYADIIAMTHPMHSPTIRLTSKFGQVLDTFIKDKVNPSYGDYVLEDKLEELLDFFTDTTWSPLLQAKFDAFGEFKMRSTEKEFQDRWAFRSGTATERSAVLMRRLQPNALANAGKILNEVRGQELSTHIRTLCRDLKIELQDNITMDLIMALDRKLGDHMYHLNVLDEKADVATKINHVLSGIDATNRQTDASHARNTGSEHGPGAIFAPAYTNNLLVAIRSKPFQDVQTKIADENNKAKILSIVYQAAREQKLAVFPAHIALGAKRQQHENPALCKVAFAASAVHDYLRLVATSDMRTGKPGPSLVSGFSMPTDILSVVKGDFTNLHKKLLKTIVALRRHCKRAKLPYETNPFDLTAIRKVQLFGSKVLHSVGVDESNGENTFSKLYDEVWDIVDEAPADSSAHAKSVIEVSLKRPSGRPVSGTRTRSRASGPTAGPRRSSLPTPTSTGN